MTSHETQSAPSVGASSAPTPLIQDRRTKPRGVLPRQTQMWLMVGLAFVIPRDHLLHGSSHTRVAALGDGSADGARAGRHRSHSDVPATARGRRSPAASGARASRPRRRPRQNRHVHRRPRSRRRIRSRTNADGVSIKASLPTASR
jgi:hypothetical protein